MDVKLKVCVGSSAGQELRVVGPRFFIGRSDDCQLRPKSELISRHHCVLLVDDEALVVRDLGSRNGTLVNNERVIGERELKPGDHLTVGPLEFEVVIEYPLASKKRPKVTSIKEAAERAAAPRAAGQGDDEVANWLGDGGAEEAETPFNLTETQHLRASETEEITLSTTIMPHHAIVKPVAQPAAPPAAQPAVQQPVQPAVQQPVQPAAQLPVQPAVPQPVQPPMTMVAAPPATVVAGPAAPAAQPVASVMPPQPPTVAPAAATPAQPAPPPGPPQPTMLPLDLAPAEPPARTTAVPKPKIAAPAAYVPETAEEAAPAEEKDSHKGPAKPPKRATADSRDAAADVLRKYFRRR